MKELVKRLRYCWLVLKKGTPAVRVLPGCKRVEFLLFERVGFDFNSGGNIMPENCVFVGGKKVEIGRDYYGSVIGG